MAAWRPAAIGFAAVVQLVLAFVAVLIPPYGPLMVGIAGGVTAGVLAGGGARPGARHGTVAGGIGAAIVVILGLAIAVSVGLGSGPLPGGPATGTSRLLWLIGSAVLMPLLGALCGAIGGAIRGTREFPHRLERERR